ncbi:heme ABC transporter ATP-binding protein [Elstera cyanobacteriorum]|uniref:Heme ABC transporter ATP-binding protein n=1 Tax=Elstera cyanobacteriorum TaxID=2022747 RepID=A0A255XMJ4_9PROT|nr:ABC transporter ATP-binding protein [Elstera cyanobacteriorum]OYQ18197.1 heme ABC transporter ATP-binding protein [Elstera cyanobacteriorum]GFZ83104.1 heme ABC transporter ATP-binding protein [Elstera cyanobacteriorum]
MTSSAARPPALDLVAINKRFGAVHANRDVSFTVAAGSIHGIVGENGAGKSTLMSIVYGFYQADSGQIKVHGAEQAIRTSQDAIRLGIGMVHQHFMLVDTLSVLENVILGIEKGVRLAPSLAAARAELERLNRDYALDVDPDALVGNLPVGLQQRVEILKALYRGAEILILDEPTGVLTPQEADHLFRILRTLKAEGKTVLLITHKLREIMDATDAVTVMRQGAVVGTVKTTETDKAQLAEMMVGRKVNLVIPKAARDPGPVVLEGRGIRLVDRRGVTLLHDLDFTVRAGEIVGVAGVSGNGQSELLDVLSGIRAPTAGEILYHGKPLPPLNGTEAARRRALGIAHVPEDRMTMGLVKPFPAYESAILGYHHDRDLQGTSGIRRLLFDRTALIARTEAFMAEFDVRPPDPLLRTSLFSGGNQQKIVLAREIHRDPDLLLIGQPTRGVDIGAIEFIHRRIVDLRDAGKAVLLVSVELDEILSLADRIIVMAAGKITGILPRAEADERRLGLMMAGETGRAGDAA